MDFTEIAEKLNAKNPSSRHEKPPSRHSCIYE
jgi:hypothetical protein